MALLLRNGQDNKNAYKSLIVAEYCGVKVEHEKKLQMRASDYFGLLSNQQETDLFLNNRVFHERNPVGDVPVLETPHGPLVESHAMTRYIAQLNGDNTLCGSSVFESVQIDQWMAFAAKEIDPLLTRWIYPRIGARPYKAHAEEVVIGCLKRALAIINTHLTTRTYLVGNDITLADIVMMCDLYFGFTCMMMKSFTSEFPHVERYFWNLVGLPNFKKILGEVKQTDSLLLPERPSGGEIYLDRALFKSQKEQGMVFGFGNVEEEITAEKWEIGMLEIQKESMNQMIGGPQERAKRMIEGQKRVLRMLEIKKECVNEEIEAETWRLNQMVEAAERASVGN